MRRQTQHIADRLERETLTNMLVAQLWRASLRTIQSQSLRGKEIDEHAAALSADAIHDMGFCLLPQKYKGLENQPSNVEIGTKLIVLGEIAFKNIDLLRNNPDVLRLVRREQAKRDDYWTKRFKFMLKPSVLGDRRTIATLEAQIGVQQEIERQTLLLRNDPEAA
ncbi:MAG: hypothetical protein AAB459_04495 [Patescibacteria group bacterium]